MRILGMNMILAIVNEPIAKISIAAADTSFAIFMSSRIFFFISLVVAFFFLFFFSFFPLFIFLITNPIVKKFIILKTSPYKFLNTEIKATTDAIEKKIREDIKI